MNKSTKLAVIKLLTQANEEQASAVHQAAIALKGVDVRAEERASELGIELNDLNPDGFDLIMAFITLMFYTQRETNALLRAIYVAISADPNEDDSESATPSDWGPTPLGDLLEQFFQTAPTDTPEPQEEPTEDAVDANSPA